MTKLDTAALAVQWGRTQMGEFVIILALPVQVKGQPAYAPIFAFTLSQEDFDRLKADVHAPPGITIAQTLPKSNGHLLDLKGG